MHRHAAARTLLSTFYILLLISCSSRSPASVPPTWTPRPSATPPPTETPLPTETATPFPTLAPELERPQYLIDLQLNYSKKAAVVNETVTYPNWTGETLTNLVLAVEPNLWSGGFNLRSLAVDDRPVTDYTLENLSQRLEIQLPEPLPPSRTITIDMTYGLILPEMQAYTDPNEVRPQIYGYSERQTNLVDWYPFVVPYVPGAGWLLHNPWFYGEHLVYGPADFDVTITFTDGSDPLIAASGEEVESITAGSRRFVLEAGRTLFNVAMQKADGVTVYSYYFTYYEDAGKALLRTTLEALQVYIERFGPYRHKTLTAVQGDFNDGMEFSAFYFISRDYFNLYDGTPRNYLVTIGAHETAHQWWFDAVANDQALEPWLDEALATYSEHLYYETVHPDDVSWWWGYRYFEFQKAGFVDTPIYEGGGQRPYWDKVYLTGARFLEDLRKRTGDETFFAFLRDYYARYTSRRAAATDFFQVLRENTAVDISDLMTRYFQNSY